MAHRVLEIIFEDGSPIYELVEVDQRTMEIHRCGAKPASGFSFTGPTLSKLVEALTEAGAKRHVPSH